MKRQVACLFIRGAGVNQKALEPSAPSRRRDAREFDPKVWKFCEAGSGSLLHRERIDLGNSGAVETDDIESEIRRHKRCVSGGWTARRRQGCWRSHVTRALRCKTNREVGAAVRCAVEHRNDCLDEGRFDELSLGLWCPVS